MAQAVYGDPKRRTPGNTGGCRHISSASLPFLVSCSRKVHGRTASVIISRSPIGHYDWTTTRQLYCSCPDRLRRQGLRHTSGTKPYSKISAACDHDQEICLDRFLRWFHSRQHAAVALGRRRRNRRNLGKLSLGPVSLAWQLRNEHAREVTRTEPLNLLVFLSIG